MISKEELTKRFRMILKLEEAAVAVYKEHIEEFEDENIRKNLTRILEQEKNHVLYAKKMCEIIEGSV